MKLRGMREDDLVALLLRGAPPGRDVRHGPGDDCAVIGRRGERFWSLLKTDCVLEGVHFDSADASAKIGWKALARAVSDIAAMGGLPRHALVSIAASPDTELCRVRAIYAGLKKCARQFGIGLVGGETSRSLGGMFICVMLTGDVEPKRCVLRSGGKPGDLLFVTGRLGGSRAGRHLHFMPRVEEARWLTKHFHLHAMMDLSDGLGADLPRLARASGCGYELDEAALPLTPGCTVGQGISDGEDYELLFTAPPREARKLEAKWRAHFPRLPLTRIGGLTGPTTARASKKQIHGYDHFA